VLGAWSHCTHHFHNQTRSGSTEDCAKERDQQWKWFGARWREIGYDASAIQAVAATVFWISTITGIPGVIDMNNVGLTDGIYWVPQVIGGSGFIISRYSNHSLLLLIIVSSSFLKRSQSGIISVHSTRSAGMLDFGTW